MPSQQLQRSIYTVVREILTFLRQIIIVLPIFIIAGVVAQLYLLIRGALNKQQIRPIKSAAVAQNQGDHKPKSLNVMITGASGGLAHALATAYARRAVAEKIKLHLVLVARRESRLHQISEEIQKEYPETNVVVKALDVCDAKATRAVVEQVDRELTGGLHVCIANAGINEPVLKAQGTAMSDDDITREILNVNLMGVINVAYPVLDVFKQHGQSVHRQIAVIGSIAAAVPNTNAYGLSKSAVLEFSRMLRYKLEVAGSKHIGVTCICPGVVGPTELSRSYLLSSGLAGKASVIPTDLAAEYIITAAEFNEEIASFPHWQFNTLRVFSWLPVPVQSALLRVVPSRLLVF